MRSFIFPTMALALWLAFPAAPTEAKAAKMLDLTDTVLAGRITTKFAALLRASDLGSFLSSRGPFTLFVPTDSAFSRIPPDTMAALLRPENKEIAQKIILFHAINGQRLDDKNLAALKKPILSCEGHPLNFRVSHTGYQMVEKAKILRADVRCANGLIQEIDTVLLPPGVSLDNLAPPAPETPAVVAPGPSSNDVDLTSPPPSTNAAPPSEPSTNEANPTAPPETPSPSTNDTASPAPPAPAPATNAAPSSTNTP